MKKAILLLILIVLSCAGGFGQAKEITQDEFFSMFRNALDLTNASKRRVKTEKSIYEDGQIIKTETKINEIINENTQRFILIEKEAGKTNKTEWIKTKSKIFTRKNNDKWTKTKVWENGSIDSTVMGNPEYTSEKVKIGNKEVTLLQSFTKYYFNSVQLFIVDKIYINEKGYVLKTEMSFGEYEPRKVEYNEIADYEYNPKDIKPIEAPIK